MSERAATAAATTVLDDAIATRLCSAAVAEVGTTADVLWRNAVGSLSFADDARPADGDTVFDLASLTKPIATTSIVLGLVADRRLTLEDRVAAFIGEWRGADHERVTIRDLLEHASGLPARLVDLPPPGRREFEHEICRTPLEYEPRSRSIYSDLGFILLGFIASDRGEAPLDVLFESIVVTLEEPGRSGGDDSRVPFLSYQVPAAVRGRTAVTEPLADDIRRGRTLRGEVHDSYAARLDGVAGHAGLFGSAPAVGRFARAILRGLREAGAVPTPFSPQVLRLAVQRSQVPGSSRALGWDTMLPASSCGRFMSPDAFGHVGFTGTSLWIDPARDRYYVLLTNRAAGQGSLDGMARTRRAFHESLAAL